MSTTLIGGRYWFQNDDKRGEGNYGAVYRAYDIKYSTIERLSENKESSTKEWERESRCECQEEQLERESEKRCTVCASEHLYADNSLKNLEKKYCWNNNERCEEQEQKEELELEEKKDSCTNINNNTVVIGHNDENYINNDNKRHNAATEDCYCYNEIKQSSGENVVAVKVMQNKYELSGIDTSVIHEIMILHKIAAEYEIYKRRKRKITVCLSLPHIFTSAKVVNNNNNDNNNLTDEMSKNTTFSFSPTFTIPRHNEEHFSERNNNICNQRCNKCTSSNNNEQHVNRITMNNNVECKLEESFDVCNEAVYNPLHTFYFPSELSECELSVENVLSDNTAIADSSDNDKTSNTFRLMMEHREPYEQQQQQQWEQQQSAEYCWQSFERSRECESGNRSLVVNHIANECHDKSSLQVMHEQTEKTKPLWKSNYRSNIDENNDNNSRNNIELHETKLNATVEACQNTCERKETPFHHISKNLIIPENPRMFADLSNFPQEGHDVLLKNNVFCGVTRINKKEEEQHLQQQQQQEQQQEQQTMKEEQQYRKCLHSEEITNECECEHVEQSEHEALYCCVDAVQEVVSSGVEHVVHMRDLIIDNEHNSVYLIMEYCDAGNLRRYLQHLPEHKITNKKMLQRWATQITAGLAFLHSIHISHCDVKTENILLQHVSSGTTSTEQQEEEEEEQEEEEKNQTCKESLQQQHTEQSINYKTEMPHTYECYKESENLKETERCLYKPENGTRTDHTEITSCVSHNSQVNGNFLNRRIKDKDNNATNNNNSSNNNNNKTNSNVTTSNKRCNNAGCNAISGRTCVSNKKEDDSNNKEDYRLKICDFGLSHVEDIPVKKFKHPAVTLWYRPPDVLLNNMNYTYTADAWSLGCVLMEMAVGVAPFRAFNEYEQLQCIFKRLGKPTAQNFPSAFNYPCERTLEPLIHFDHSNNTHHKFNSDTHNNSIECELHHGQFRRSKHTSSNKERILNSGDNTTNHISTENKHPTRLQHSLSSSNINTCQISADKIKAHLEECVTHVRRRLRKYLIAHNSLKVLGRSGLDLVSRLLQYEPVYRLSVVDAMHHPFFNDEVYAFCAHRYSEFNLLNASESKAECLRFIERAKTDISLSKSRIASSHSLYKKEEEMRKSTKKGVNLEHTNFEEPDICTIESDKTIEYKELDKIEGTPNSHKPIDNTTSLMNNCTSVNQICHYNNNNNNNNNNSNIDNSNNTHRQEEEEEQENTSLTTLSLQMSSWPPLLEPLVCPTPPPPPLETSSLTPLPTFQEFHTLTEEESCLHDDMLASNKCDNSVNVNVEIKCHDNISQHVEEKYTPHINTLINYTTLPSKKPRVSNSYAALSTFALVPSSLQTSHIHHRSRELPPLPLSSQQEQEQEQQQHRRYSLQTLQETRKSYQKTLPWEIVSQVKNDLPQEVNPLSEIQKRKMEITLWQEEREKESVVHNRQVTLNNMSNDKCCISASCQNKTTSKAVNNNRVNEKTNDRIIYRCISEMETNSRQAAMFTSPLIEEDSCKECKTVTNTSNSHFVKKRLKSIQNDMTLAYVTKPRKAHDDSFEEEIDKIFKKK